MARAAFRPALALAALALAWAWIASGPATAAVPSGGGVQAAPASASADLAKLKQLSNAWDKAIVARDRAAVADNMGEDFRIIDGQGNIEDKRRFIDGVLDPKLTIDPYTVEDFEIRLYGDMALLSGRTRMTGKYDGEPFESNYRYIDIYVRREGTWQIVSVQITRFPPAAQ